MTDAIVLDGLSKRFGTLMAVNNLSLRVPAGSVYGFLGLNGAGKTTTIRILLDLLRPSSGHASMLGFCCQADGLRARSAVGYLPGELKLYPDMTGRQVLDLLAQLSGRQTDPQLQRSLLERLALPGRDLERRIAEYSTGMKRKLGIVQAFQSGPELLILDEPTEGLDPLMQEQFYQLLAETSQQGRTVFMSSHVLSEVERVCHRVGVLRTGRLVLDAPVDEVRRLAPRRVRVSFREDVAAPPAWPPGIDALSITPAQWDLRVTGELGPLVPVLGTLPVADLEVVERRLEDVIIEYYPGDGVMHTTLVLIGHSVRRLRATTLGMAAVLAGFQLLLAAMASWVRSQSAFAQLEGLVPPAMRQLMGQSLVTMFSVSGVVALGYFHTAVEAALVILVLVIASEPADEIDAGFADLVLSRSVRRRAVMTRTLVLVMLGPAVVVTAMGIGTAAGARWVIPASMDGPPVVLVLSLMLNLWLLLVAWGGMAMAVASVSRKRNRVMSLVGIVALVALLIDYLARAWTPIQRMAWISPFHYYSPLDLVMGAAVPPRDILTLAGIAAAGTVIAFVAFAQRDL